MKIFSDKIDLERCIMKPQKVVNTKLILMLVLFASLLAFAGSGCSGGNGNIEGSGGESGESGHGDGDGEVAEAGHDETESEDSDAGGFILIRMNI